MKIGYISDLHLDAWYKFAVDEEVIIGAIAPQKADILLIAGDIYSGDNHDNEKLITPLKEYYTNICIVPGNHDFYTTLGIGFQDKMKLFRDSYEKLGVHVCNGVIKISDINIGGLSFWYHIDGEKNTELWKRNMNDSRYIKNFSSNEYFQEQMNILEGLENIDVLFTHVPPIITPDKGIFEGNQTNQFFEYDAMEIVKKTGTKYVIFGHQHKVYDFKREGIRFLCNPLGYPFEKKYTTIKHFDIN